MMNSKLQTFIAIMAFYVALAYIAFPLGFYYFVDKSLMSAGNGFVVGSILSVILWFAFGQKMIK